MTNFSKPMVMTERQRRFRETYRANISPFYNGLLHVGVIYAVGISLLVYCFQQLDQATWAWLMVLPVAVAGNFGEWAMHKYVMHRHIDVFALRAIYDRHTRQHHQYFTDTDYTIDSVREFRIVFFPWRVLTVLGLGGCAVALVSVCVWRERGLYRVHDGDRPLCVVRDIPLLLPHPGKRFCAAHAVHQHHTPPSRRTPQPWHHDA